MRRADTLNHLHVPIVFQCGGLNLPEPSGPVHACNGVALPLPLPFCVKGTEFFLFFWMNLVQPVTSAFTTTVQKEQSNN